MSPRKASRNGFDRELECTRNPSRVSTPSWPAAKVWTIYTERRLPFDEISEESRVAERLIDLLLGGRTPDSSNSRIFADIHGSIGVSQEQEKIGAAFDCTTWPTPRINALARWESQGSPQTPTSPVIRTTRRKARAPRRASDNAEQRVTRYSLGELSPPAVKWKVREGAAK